MNSDKPPPLVNRFFHTCLLMLGAVIVLTIAVELLRVILPWLVTSALVVGAVYVVWRVAGRRRDSW